jgi:hypothetical protein
MQDPAVLPWSMVAVGVVIAMGGAILAMSGWGQRQARMTDVLGQWVVGLGLAFALGIVGINALVYIANGIGTIMHQSFASASQPGAPQE